MSETKTISKATTGGLGGLLRPRVWVPILLLALLFLGPVLVQGDQYLLHVLILTLLFGYWASCWNIVSGYTGPLSLGHAAYAGVGAYTSTLLFINLGITPWIGMFAGGLAGTIVGAIIGYPCLRLKGPYFALVTLAFAEILRTWVSNTVKVGNLNLNASMGLLVPIKRDPLFFEFVSKEPFYYIILVMTLLILAFVYWMERSKFGYQLAAVRTNDEAAESLGVDVTKTKMLAFMVSAFLTGVGGTFYAQYISYVDPSRILGMDLSIELALIGVLGGRGTLFGPLLGAVILTPASEITRAAFGGSVNLFGISLMPLGLHMVLYGLVMVLAMMFLPQGINWMVARVYWKVIGWIEGVGSRLRPAPA